MEARLVVLFALIPGALGAQGSASDSCADRLTQARQQIGKLDLDRARNTLDSLRARNCPGVANLEISYLKAKRDFEAFRSAEAEARTACRFEAGIAAAGVLMQTYPAGTQAAQSVRQLSRWKDAKSLIDLDLRKAAAAATVEEARKFLEEARERAKQANLPCLENPLKDAETQMKFRFGLFPGCTGGVQAVPQHGPAGSPGTFTVSLLDKGVQSVKVTVRGQNFAELQRSGIGVWTRGFRFQGIRGDVTVKFFAYDGAGQLLCQISTVIHSDGAK